MCTVLLGRFMRMGICYFHEIHHLMCRNPGENQSSSIHMIPLPHFLFVDIQPVILMFQTMD